MKWLADENVHALIVEALRQLGHQVGCIAELAPSRNDVDVLSLAVANNQILLTDDKDFGDLVFRRGLSHKGIVFMRLEGLSAMDKIARVLQIIQLHEAELANAFTVIEPDIVRIRPTIQVT